MGIVEALEPVYRLLPEVKNPEASPPLKQKIMWSAGALLLFFIMGAVVVVGIDQAANAGQLESLQVILASNIGTLITAGIGPIVLASIILQLLVGGKILEIDLTDPKGKAHFQGLQKLFAIVLCFFEAAVYTMSGLLKPYPGMLPFVILQVALGSLILLYLDEVVSKYGIGSGISLFIAGGVAQSFLWQVFRPPLPIDLITSLGLNPLLADGGYLFMFVKTFDFISFILPILIVFAIFLIIVFAEGMHVNIPIAMGKTGMGGRFPVKLLYVSNIPVILAVALFANIRIWALAVGNIPVIGVLLKGVFDFLAYITTVPSVGGLPLIEGLITIGLNAATSAALVQGLAYIIVLTACCVVFGMFWVNMGGQGPEAVAEQLSKSGMYIPGFRRDKRIILSILEKYIPPITIIGSIFVALLAGVGDMTVGALASGTGILLTVGIVYRLYEDLAKEQLMQTHPLLKRFFK
ncbi:MAG: preprotein translocase subunit SecY [Candidatus Diapherotrites archaeon]|nr:preprotein translocase subunit SecY [Candidatus Diapherotrites archaeon]